MPGVVTLAIRWERLSPGPIGSRLRVVDFDGGRGAYYEPIDLDALHVAAQAGLAGVVPLIMICVWFLSPRTYVRDDQNDTCAINLALWIAFLSAFIYQGLVGSFEDARHLWVLMGLLTATSIPHRP